LVLQLLTQKRIAPSGASAGQVPPEPRQVVTPVLGSQVQPDGSEAPQIGGSQPTVVPTLAGQVQLPFTQTGATVVVAAQPGTVQTILPRGPQPASAP
jgi:hypothetical protein